jgi:hypothetical protein
MQLVPLRFGFGSPPPGAKSSNAKGEPIGYQYFVERNQDGSPNQGSPAHNFDLEFVALQSLARNVKSGRVVCSFERRPLVSPVCVNQ